MPQVFQFGFDDEDVDDGSDKNVQMNTSETSPTPEETNFEEPKLLLLGEMLSRLPSRISYHIENFQEDGGNDIILARRDLFDIRAQLMAEDAVFKNSSIAGLSTDDITPNIYEGGFKTWECSIDLANYLVNHQNTASERYREGLHVIELGAGTGLPTLTLLKMYLHQKLLISKTAPFRMTLTDYNASVLNLATIPNLFLNSSLHTLRLNVPSSGDLESDPQRLLNFEQLLCSLNITCFAVSGAWGCAFVNLIRSEVLAPSLRTPTGSDGRLETLILASETIYSPETISPFTMTLLELLKAAEDGGGKATALVAAKKIYFGLGGGVDEFLTVLRQNGGQSKVVWEMKGEGVGRVILEITRTKSEVLQSK